MKISWTFFAVLGLLTIGLAAHADPSTCELSAKAQQSYSELTLTGCSEPDQMFCVKYTKKNGASGLEYLEPRGCGERTCWAASRNFFLVWNTDYVRNPGYYVSDRADQSLLLSCR